MLYTKSLSSEEMYFANFQLPYISRKKILLKQFSHSCVFKVTTNVLKFLSVNCSNGNKSKTKNVF